MDCYWLEMNENKYGGDDRDIYGDDEYDDNRHDDDGDDEDE